MDNFFYSIGCVIIDDIILPDGRSQMARLGGGSVHAVMGMRVWSEQVGLVAATGQDFPPGLCAQMEALFNLQGLVARQTRTPRAWQLFESDGTRNEVFRTPASELAGLIPTPAEIPTAYHQACGLHLQASAASIPNWVKTLRQNGSPIILWEPWDSFCIPANLDIVKQYLPEVDVFSPGLTESRLLTGLDDPSEILHLFLSAGAKNVALRMGAAGSLVASQTGFSAAVPALPVDNIVDVTGAGNAYCGGFLCGLNATGDLLQAGCYGAVSASFALQQFGALYDVQNIHSEALRRLANLRSSI